MRELFTIDLKDYKGTEKIYSRPSVRAIIEKDGKLLLAHVTKFDYYKFPGGGIDEGETHEQALCREVREETGYIVIPETIREYGSVYRKQLSNERPDTIFEQYNYYYICKVKEEPEKQELDDYETDEGYVPEWTDPFYAAWVNKYSNADEVEIVTREHRVLLMYDNERREQARTDGEKAFYSKMQEESPTKDNFGEMVEFVRSILGDSDHEPKGAFAKTEIAYSRFNHTRRVLGWSKRLYEATPDRKELRFADIMIATIFHDVGRIDSKILKIPHAHAGVPITRKYLEEHGYDPERIDYICMLVEKHSDKYLMEQPDIDRGLLLLMEADLLDDMGALGIAMDCMIVRGMSSEAKFTDVVDHIDRFTFSQHKVNPLVTVQGRKFWDDKTKLVNEFMYQFQKDVEFFRE